MRRVLGSAALAMAFVVAVALPAQAKGEEEMVTSEAVAIVGPGLSGSMKFDQRQAPVYGEFTRTFSGSKMAIRPTEIDLGPAYNVLYTISCPQEDGTTSIVSYHQVLYPYATFASFTRPWTYTPGGQPACGWLSSPGAGWVASSADLTAVLIDHGLPSTPPAAPAQPVVPDPKRVPVPQPGGFPLWAFLALASVLTAGLVAAGLVTRQAVHRRRTLA